MVGKKLILIISVLTDLAASSFSIANYTSEMQGFVGDKV